MLDMTRDEYMKYLTSELVPQDEVKQTLFQKVLGRLWNWGADR